LREDIVGQRISPVNSDNIPIIGNTLPETDNIIPENNIPETDDLEIGPSIENLMDTLIDLT
jgi:hypothetical protein